MKSVVAMNDPDELVAKGDREHRASPIDAHVGSRVRLRRTLLDGSALPAGGRCGFGPGSGAGRGRFGRRRGRKDEAAQQQDAEQDQETHGRHYRSWCSSEAEFMQ